MVDTVVTCQVHGLNWQSEISILLINHVFCSHLEQSRFYGLRTIYLYVSTSCCLHQFICISKASNVGWTVRRLSECIRKTIEVAEQKSTKAKTNGNHHKLNGIG